MNTSKAFVVYLPSSTTDEQIAKVITWAQTTCDKSDLIFSADKEVKLIVVRKEVKSLRSLQRLLSTNFGNWGIKNLKKGWIKLILADHFDLEKQHFESGDQTPETTSDAIPIEAAKPTPFVSASSPDPCRTTELETVASRTRFTLPVSLLRVH